MDLDKANWLPDRLPVGLWSQVLILSFAPRSTLPCAALASLPAHLYRLYQRAPCSHFQLCFVGRNQRAGVSWLQALSCSLLGWLPLGLEGLNTFYCCNWTGTIVFHWWMWAIVTDFFLIYTYILLFFFFSNELSPWRAESYYFLVPKNKYYLFLLIEPFNGESFEILLVCS